MLKVDEAQKRLSLGLKESYFEGDEDAAPAEGNGALADGDLETQLAEAAAQAEGALPPMHVLQLTVCQCLNMHHASCCSHHICMRCHH